MAGALVDARCTSLGTGLEATQGRTFVGVASLDVQSFGFEAIVVHGVGNSRCQHFANHASSFTLGELQDLIGHHNIATANEIEDNACFRC